MASPGCRWHSRVKISTPTSNTTHIQSTNKPGPFLFRRERILQTLKLLEKFDTHKMKELRQHIFRLRISLLASMSSNRMAEDTSIERFQSWMYTQTRARHQSEAVSYIQSLLPASSFFTALTFSAGTWKKVNQSSSSCVPVGSPSRGGDVAVYVFDIRACPLLFFTLCSCVFFFGLYGPFSYISFHKFSRQLSAFSLCSSGLFLPHWSFQLYISSWKSPSALI